MIHHHWIATLHSTLDLSIALQREFWSQDQFVQREFVWSHYNHFKENHNITSKGICLITLQRDFWIVRFVQFWFWHPWLLSAPLALVGRLLLCTVITAKSLWCLGDAIGAEVPIVAAVYSCTAWSRTWHRMLLQIGTTLSWLNLLKVCMLCGGVGGRGWRVRRLVIQRKQLRVEPHHCSGRVVEKGVVLLCALSLNVIHLRALVAEQLVVEPLVDETFKICSR